MRRALVLAITACLSACGLVFVVGTPGAGVDRDFAARYNCDADSIKARARELRERLPSGSSYTPLVGWDACEVLAHVGIPTNITSVATQYGSSQNWHYTTSTSSGLVTMGPGTGNKRMTATAVVW